MTPTAPIALWITESYVADAADLLHKAARVAAANGAPTAILQAIQQAAADVDAIARRTAEAAEATGARSE